MEGKDLVSTQRGIGVALSELWRVRYLVSTQRGIGAALSELWRVR